MDQEYSKKIPSNEEIIEELTKNLKESCIKLEDDDNKSSDENLNNTEKEDDVTNKIDVRETDSKHSFNSLNSEDEEEIKNRDLNLTEHEIEIYKDKAEQLKLEGNVLFKGGYYEKAADLYSLAIRTLPVIYKRERAILYANRAAARAQFMDDKTEAIIDCSKSIDLNPTYVKPYVRRAHLYEETEHLDEALADFKKILGFDPQHIEAKLAVRRLPVLIEEKNEKLKIEMLDKLKDLGNMILRPFGLSTNNFELEKNPNTEQYTVKFKQNSN